YGSSSPSELAVLTGALVAAFGAVAIAVFLEQGMRGRPQPAVLGAVLTLGAALYLGYFFGYLIELWLANDAGTRGWLGTLPVWLLLALVPTWAADVAAYVVGARIGRRKIAPRISPGKTWEGTLAGVGAAAVVVRPALLGATGAIRVPALVVLRRHRDRLRVTALAAARNASALEALAAETGAVTTVLQERDGDDALCDLATRDDVDLVLVATPGIAGLAPTVAALRAGKRVALANKEVLVTGGHLVAPLAGGPGARP